MVFGKKGVYSSYTLRGNCFLHVAILGTVVDAPENGTIEFKFYRKRSGGIMKIEWSKWNVGGKIIFIAGSMAVISMFMNWVDFGITARIGISQGAFLILVFWIYPIYMLLNNRIIELRWGLPSAILSILAVIIYIASKSKSLAGYSDNFSAIGAWLFLIASIALTIGVAKYLPIDANTGEEEERKLALEKLAKMLLLVVLFAVGLSMLGYWLFTPSNKVSAIHLISGLICIGLVIWIGKSLKEPSSRKEIVTEKTKSLKVQGSYVSNFVIRFFLVVPFLALSLPLQVHSAYRTPTLALLKL